MGECLIVRRGGLMYEMPKLNARYPEDITVVESSTSQASFRIILTNSNDTTCTYQWYVNDEAVTDATSSTYTKTGLTTTGTYTVYCDVTNSTGTTRSRTATLTVASAKPTYTYTGSHQLIDDGDYNWRIKFLTSGILRFSSLGNSNSKVDVFCVGGGGGGSTYKPNVASGAGGGGGYTCTENDVDIEVNTDYAITIGGGGAPAQGVGARGGTTTAFTCVADGGYGGGSGDNGYCGGAGGSGGGGAGSGEDGYSGRGGTNGGRGADGNAGTGGVGQNSTTREFGSDDENEKLYGAGGAGARVQYVNSQSGGSLGGGSVTDGVGGSGSANSGGGGAGSGSIAAGVTAGSGGSGIAIIRNKR